METLVKQEAIDILRVFFYRYPSFGLLAKATHDYQVCFGLDDIQANHVAIQLGSKVYEVSLEGTSCYEFDESLLENEHLVYVYECDISELAEEDKLAARFTLDYDVLTNRKLKPLECLGYLRHWFFSTRFAFDFTLDFNLKPGTIVKRRFNLPYTCASQAAHVFSRLFGLVPVADSHLPTTMLWMSLAMVESNYGTLYNTSL